MKKTLTILSVALVAVMLTSCVESSKKYKQLLAEKETLTAQYQELENEYNTANAVISEVENNLQAIRDAEGLVQMMNEGEVTRERLSAELIQIKDVMAANHAKLDSLEQVLKKSKNDNGYLRNTIKKLQAQITEKETLIAQMQEQLNQKDAQIEGLNTQVAALNTNVAELNAKNQKQEEFIKNQTDDMNVVYYIGAVRKELKAKGILASGEILKKNVPTEAFTKADRRNLNEVTFEGKIRRVYSSHPAGSFTVEGNTLKINDPESFWSITKYLVVRTK